MKHYTSTDLIRQALDLANMQNTDFLSQEELQNYINDAFMSVYSEAINAGDLYWLKSAIGIKSIGGNGYTEYKLPWDFFTMRKLSTSSGQVIPRKASTVENGLCYDIINDKLRVHGMSDGVKLEYFPNPPTITVPYKKQLIDLPIPTNGVISSSGSKIVVADDNKIQVFDYKSNTIDSIDFEGEVLDIIAGKSAFIVHYLIEEEQATDVYLYDLTLIGSLSQAEYVLHDEHNNLYYFDGDNNICALDGSIVSTSFNVKGNGIIYLNQERPIIAYVDSESKEVVFDNGHRIINTGIITDEIKYCEGYDSPYSLICRVNNDIITIELNPDDTITYSKTPIDGIKLLSFSNDGLIIFDGNIYNQDWRTNTTFNYPNNLFYRYIAAQLAAYFGLKSNANMDVLTTAVATYGQQFMKNLEASASYQRIQNVY